MSMNANEGMLAGSADTILMLILMLLNVRTEYLDVDAEFLLRLCPCTVREICRNY